VNEPDWKRPLGEAFDQALAYLEGLPTRPVPGRAGLAELRATLGGPLPERPLDPRDVVAELARAAEPGVVASAGGRYFGFVVGGATPAALAADWLTSAGDQNAALYVLGPAASPRLRPLVAGVERADSWATDAHKWLNVPYDSGLVFCAHPEAHRAAMGTRAGYLIHGRGDQRDSLDYNPDHSRRARGSAVYAAIRALGRQGVADLLERCCGLAGRFAELLGAADGVEVLNQVVLNQVLVRFLAADGDHDARTRRVAERTQQDGTCWMSGTTWQGKAAMRISVSNWSTDEADVDRSVAAILCRAAE
jgi:selenocysteine lyase/cysteine desulfurase